MLNRILSSVDHQFPPTSHRLLPFVDLACLRRVLHMWGGGNGNGSGSRDKEWGISLFCRMGFLHTFKVIELLNNTVVILVFVTASKLGVTVHQKMIRSQCPPTLENKTPSSSHYLNRCEVSTQILDPGPISLPRPHGPSS
jgi:hypothetical protein